jgi:hypothetical protein
VTTPAAIFGVRNGGLVFASVRVRILDLSRSDIDNQLGELRGDAWAFS